MKRLRVDMHPRAYEKYVKQKELDGFKRKSHGDYLEWKFRDTPLNPTIYQMLRSATRSNLAPMWMWNFARNLPRIHKTDRTLRQLNVENPPVEGKAVVVGRGPSIFRKGHLELVRRHRKELTVVACDGMLKECVKAGVVPDYVVAVDGSEVCTKWYDGLEGYSIIKENQLGYRSYQWLPDEGWDVEQTKMILGTYSHPKVVQLVYDLFGRDNIHWFVPANDIITDNPYGITLNMTLLTASEVNPNGMVALDCGGQVGTTSYVFTWQVLGFKKVCLIGLDCGYPADMPFDKTYYWEQVLHHLPAYEGSTLMEYFTNPFTNEEYYMDRVFKGYRETFLDMVIRQPDWFELSNASSGTLYMPPFIKPVHLESWLRE